MVVVRYSASPVLPCWQALSSLGMGPGGIVDTKILSSFCAAVSIQVFPTLPPISTTSTSCPSAAAGVFML